MDEFNLTAEPTSQPEFKSILPRSAWFSQLAQLRLLLRAKQALDRQEMDSSLRKSKA